MKVEVNVERPAISEEAKSIWATFIMLSCLGLFIAGWIRAIVWVFESPLDDWWVVPVIILPLAALIALITE